MNRCSLLLLGLVVVGCDRPSPSPLVCAPGVSAPCTCASGEPGAQSCAFDGSRYEACRCEPTTYECVGTAERPCACGTAAGVQRCFGGRWDACSCGPVEPDAGMGVLADAGVTNDAGASRPAVGGTTVSWGIPTPSYFGPEYVSVGSQRPLSECDVYDAEGPCRFIECLPAGGIVPVTHGAIEVRSRGTTIMLRPLTPNLSVGEAEYPGVDPARVLHAGSVSVPAFDVAVPVSRRAAPPTVLFDGYDVVGLTTLQRSRDHRLVWSRFGDGASELILWMGYAGLGLECRWPAGDEGGTIPARLLEGLDYGPVSFSLRTEHVTATEVPTLEGPWRVQTVVSVGLGGRDVEVVP